MARALNRLTILLFCAGMTLGLASAAPVLPDPTRPPGGMASGNALTGADPYAVQPTSSGPQLQSVILRPGAKPRAMIDGELYELGQTFGDARIVRILADRVQIKGPQGRETLKMMPDVDRRAVVLKPATERTRETSK